MLTKTGVKSSFAIAGINDIFITYSNTKHFLKNELFTILLFGYIVDQINVALTASVRDIFQKHI